MTSPRVAETPLRMEPVEPDPFIEAPLRMEPVEPDPFIEAPPRTAAAGPRQTEREERERRVELVRRLMRIQAGAVPARNGRSARPTRRA